MKNNISISKNISVTSENRERKIILEMAVSIGENPDAYLRLVDTNTGYRSSRIPEIGGKKCKTVDELVKHVNLIWNETVKLAEQVNKEIAKDEPSN